MARAVNNLLLLDPIYAVAFSILLLHTDAHNKNVKRKMNKDTFIRRTRLIEGGDTVYSEVLDVGYKRELTNYIIMLIDRLYCIILRSCTIT
jgi:Sec7-like guanine-nucleotide exchange factor